MSQRCAVKAKSTGNQCARYAIAGGTCLVHGSGSAQARAAAARRLEEKAAKAAVVTLGLSVDISPSDALLEEVRWTAGHVQWLRGRIQELKKRDLVWGKTKTSTKVTEKEFEGMAIEDVEETTVKSAALSLWYDTYERERKSLVIVCTAALKAGVEERRAQLAEAQGQQVAGAIRAILADLGLSADQQARVSEIVPRHLRLLAGVAWTACSRHVTQRCSPRTPPR